MKYPWALLTALLLFAGPQQAAARQDANARTPPASSPDEGRRLVVGSVYKVVKNLVEVQQDGGGLAIIKVDAATSYLNSSTEKRAKLKDLAVGDQIVVKVVVKDGVDTAQEVKFVPATGSNRLVI